MKEPREVKRRIRWYHIFAGLLLLLALLVFWWVRSTFYAPKFTPIELSQPEQVVLEQKLEKVSDPDAYSEESASRTVVFTEREINALFAEEGERFFINLSDDLVSVRALVAVPEDFPIAGGKTIKVTAGLELAVKGSSPVIKIKGVSLGGIPLPNAWLGYLKGVNLAGEIADGGFWKGLSRGVDGISVDSGQIEVRLKE